MGTRSLTYVGDKRAVVAMYRQMDGYPSGHGMDLYKFLKDFKMVNGFCGDPGGPIANGAGCLAAQIVAEFKNGPGGIYLYPTDVDDCGQEYEYYISANEETGIHVECSVPYFDGKERNVGKSRVLYSGTLEGFGAFCLED